MDDLLCEQRSIQVDELVVVDQKKNDVGLLDRGLSLGEGYVLASFQLCRKLFDVRFDRENRRFRKLLSKTIDDMTSRALTQVINVWFERQS